MTENNQNRILRVATLLADASYPILSGLDDHEIKDIEAKLQKEIPEVCKDILRVLNWAGEDVAVDSVVMQESSPIGEIVFNGFFLSIAVMILRFFGYWSLIIAFFSPCLFIIWLTVFGHFHHRLLHLLLYIFL